MTLVPYNKNEIDDIKINEERIKVIKTIVEFVETGHECVEIVDHPYSCGVSCRSAFASAIDRCGLVGIKVRIRGERVFLIKEC